MGNSVWMQKKALNQNSGLVRVTIPIKQATIWCHSCPDVDFFLKIEGKSQKHDPTDTSVCASSVGDPLIMFNHLNIEIVPCVIGRISNQLISLSHCLQFDQTKPKGREKSRFNTDSLVVFYPVANCVKARPQLMNMLWHWLQRDNRKIFMFPGWLSTQYHSASSWAIPSVVYCETRDKEGLRVHGIVGHAANVVVGEVAGGGFKGNLVDGGVC